MVRKRHKNKAIRLVLALCTLALCAGSLGCIGPRTMLRVPECVERIEVSGEHHRVSETDLVFSHTLDLPLSRTEIIVERPDGTREKIMIYNTNPDLLRLTGAGIVGALSVFAVGLYAYQVGIGREAPLLGPTFLALPIGIVGGLLAVTIAATGWHPSSDIEVPAQCGTMAGPGGS